MTIGALCSEPAIRGISVASQLLVVLSFILLGGWAAKAHSESQQDVYYAGFAYLGQHKLIQENYPHALRLNAAKSGPGALEKALIQQIKQNPPKGMNLRLDLADRRDSDRNIVFALAIEHEYASAYTYKQGKTKLVAEVSAQLLFFDFGNMTLVANLPLHKSAVDITQASGNELTEEFEAMFEAIYLGAGAFQSKSTAQSEQGLLAEAARVLQGFTFSEHVKDVRLQVSNVEFVPDLHGHLPESVSVAGFKQHVGQYFSAELSSHYRLAVLPYVRGYALGRKMPGRFANGDIFTLSLPEPDFVFEFDVTRFKRDQIENSIFYQAYGHLKFSDPLMGRAYIDGDYKMAVQTPITLAGIEDWGGYNDAVEELITNLVVQLGKPDDDWFDIHARTASRSYKNFKTKRDLFSEVIRQ